MKKVPNWVWIVLGLTFISLIFSPFVGVIAIVLLIAYLNNHGYFNKRNSVSNGPGPIPNRTIKRDIPKPRKQSGNVPPQFVRKIEFLSNREIAFSNFTSARYLEENGSHQMVDVKNPKNSKIYIRLNKDQFDVFVDCNGKREQLSFEKSNLKILDITNHGISMIEGNQDDSYLKINYDNQYFTTLEVHELMDFFNEFRISNKTTKFQSVPIVEDVTMVKTPSAKKSIGKRVALISLGVIVVLTTIVCTIGFASSKQEIYQNSIMGTRRNTKYFNKISYEVNNEVKEESWSDYKAIYTFSNKDIPQVYIRNDITGTDYTEIYNYDKSTFNTLENELSCFEYMYDAKKKQYDFVNLENGKWYHFSGIIDSNDLYEADMNKDIFVDIYVMPTNQSLIQVTMYRTVDDMCDYDIIDFISGFDFHELMTYDL